MLFLLFHLGRERYALEAGQVAAVLPLLIIKEIPQAPPAVAGLSNYRGTPVPVIDLSELTLGRPAQSRLSTRIILVHYADERGEPRLLGLLAEKATETLRRDPADFASSGVTIDAARYLGRVTADPHGLIQRIEVSQLLPASVRDLLFNESTEH